MTRPHRLSRNINVDANRCTAHIGRPRTPSRRSWLQCTYNRTHAWKGTPVALIEYRYECPFKFTGTINKLIFELGPPQYTAEDRKQLPAIADRVARAKD